MISWTPTAKEIWLPCTEWAKLSGEKAAHQEIDEHRKNKTFKKHGFLLETVHCAGVWMSRYCSKKIDPPVYG